MATTTLSALRQDFLQRQALAARSASTLHRYGRYLDDFVAYARRRGVPPEAAATKLTPELLTSYQVALSERRTEDGEPLSLSTRNLYASALRGMLRHGVTTLRLAV